VIDATNDNLVGLARAINVKNAGVTASIVEDSNGARLVPQERHGRGEGLYAAGASRWRRSASPASPMIQMPPAGMTRAQQRKDAILKLDGVQINRPDQQRHRSDHGHHHRSQAAKPGTTITLGAATADPAIKQGVADFVGAYNELKTILDEATAIGSGNYRPGPLRGDNGIREMQRQLARLTATKLSSADGPSTLGRNRRPHRTQRHADARHGASRRMLLADPDGVEALFNPGQQSDNPLVTITSPMAAQSRATYAATDLVASSGGQAATGKIAGMDAISAGSRLVASIASPAKGLVIELLGNVPSATITVDQGLGGALQAIRDALLANSGPIKSTQARLTAETKTISADRTTLEARSTTITTSSSAPSRRWTGRSTPTRQRRATSNSRSSSGPTATTEPAHRGNEGIK
jgi:flagellar hook-associated protein 2